MTEAIPGVGDTRTSDFLDCRCRCGSFRGTITLGRRWQRRRAVCYCKDCQAFQHALGSADLVLDAEGGTDILMLSPASLSIEAGKAHLALLRLSPKGLLRWYASCCDTPIGNTPPARAIPHLGLITGGVVAGRDRAGHAGAEGEALAAVDAAFGGPSERIFGSQATGHPPPGTHPKFPLSSLPPIAVAMFARVLAGDHRRSLFYAEDGSPAREARVLSEADRKALPPYALD